eukprot:GILI01024257.1.p1 GENE.GILI01024257.1~~GILI01024257.1.p1  ORF type:complete len:436 (-),score=20.38 GILI01024257.1:40-1347(-)
MQAHQARADRDRLIADCQLHSPPHLQRYMAKAIELLDVEVASGRRPYAQVQVTNVMTVATKLQQHEMAQAAPVSNTSTVPIPIGIKRARTPDRSPSDTNAEILGNLINPSFSQKGMGTFVGRSKDLERAYSRDEPSSDAIRPLAVLRIALPHIVSRAAALGEEYLSDQLKGMRQDLRAQNIRNSFAVSVYEMHARVCLRLKNLSEFNQCQSAVRSFYNEGLTGENGDCFNEFLCYRMLYLTLGDKDDLAAVELKDIEKSIRGESEMDPRSAAAFKSEAVIQVVRFCSYIQQGDSALALKLVSAFDTDFKRLLRIFLQRQRIKWLREVIGGLKGNIPSSFLLKSLGFVPVDTAQVASDVNALEFIDGTFDQSLSNWQELIKLLKFQLPTDFSFMIATQQLISGKEEQSVNVDAVSLSNAVTQYCSFLTTRTDIATE